MLYSRIPLVDRISAKYNVCYIGQNVIMFQIFLKKKNFKFHTQRVKQTSYVIYISESMQMSLILFHLGLSIKISFKVCPKLLASTRQSQVAFRGDTFFSFFFFFSININSSCILILCPWNLLHSNAESSVVMQTAWHTANLVLTL